VLPTDRSARLGRSDDVDCPINHRSVSREHAEIKREADQFVIEDLGSANGVTVNGRTVKRAELNSGDIIELGQVVFRYVGAGEHYFFDPREASHYAGGMGGFRSSNLKVGLLLAVATVAALLFILMPGQDAQQEDPETVPALTASNHDPETAAAETAALGDDVYDKEVLACRSAIAATHFAEAAAHASMALKKRPGAAEAVDCKQRADAQSEEEQAYVRGKDALQRGEPEQAYQQFAKLPDSSLFRARPEVAQAATELATSRLHEAHDLLATNRGDAARLAQSVIGLVGAPADAVTQAEQILADARQPAPPARPAAVAAAPTTPRAAAPKPTEPPKAKPPAEPARMIAKADPPKAKPAALEAPARTTAAPAAASGGPSLMEAANACLGRGDNECVIHTLEGNTNTWQELGLLVETYRAIGDAAKAQKNMATYVKRFPSAPKADAYRRMLELQSQ
jgi:hypothetical protein